MQSMQFPCITYCMVLYKQQYMVAQKECNTFDHQFQRNQGLDQISECINA